ncbi:MAG: cupin domain-containing protein [Planctomycetota bacterium]
MQLDRIPWQTTKYPGIDVHFYASDPPRSRRVLALIRMQPGCGYPRHRHRGTEEVTVLQGGYRDELGSYRAGAFVRYDEGSEHAPVAIDEPGASACVLLALAHEGVKLLG